MTLKCENGEDGEGGLIFVCHHCGVPVCENHGWIISPDDAFYDPDPRVSQAAMHCMDHVEEYHKGAPRHHKWPGQLQAADWS